MSVRLTILPAAALLALAACDDAAAPETADDRAATGEVLDGSISDEMLPIEGLSSQPPVAAPLPGEGWTAASGSADGDADAAPDAATPTPAASATPEPAAETTADE